MRVSIVIPIYNEEELIEEVLRRVQALPFDKQIILVDDHSSDRTPEICQKVVQTSPGTLYLRHEENQGKGAAIRTGIARADGEIIIIQDADLEYRPEDIPRVLEPILSGRVRVAYGSRFLGTIIGMRFPNRVGNRLLAWLVSLLYGQRITDEAAAYKAFRAEVIHSIPLTCRRFEFCPEVTAKVLRMGERIEEVPVTYTARSFEEGKKIIWPDFFMAVWTLVKYRF